MMRSYHQKLARVLDAMGGLYTLDDILERLADGRMQSFAHNNSWAITQINLFPRQRTLQIVAVVGDLADARVLHDRVLEYADKVNAGVVTAYGRMGWIPDARAHGWRLKAKSYIFHKDM